MSETEKINPGHLEAITDNESWTVDDYVRLWHDVETRVTTAVNTGNWLKGEIAARVGSRYGEGTLREFAEKTGESVSSLMSYRTTAQAWDEKSRRLEISWSVHQVLASQEDRAELLASREEWTVSEAREIVRERSEAESERKRQAELDTLRETRNLTTRQAEKLQRAQADQRRRDRQEQREQERQVHVHNAVRFTCLPPCGIHLDGDTGRLSDPGLAAKLISVMGKDSARRLADEITHGLSGS